MVTDMPEETPANVTTASFSLPRGWVETFTDDRVVIRRPTGLRGLFTFLALLFGVLSCAGIALAVAIGRENLGIAIFLFVIALLIGVGCVLIMPQAGPLRLECDLRQGTYRFHYAAPALTTTTGSLGDFTDVLVDLVTNPKAGGMTYRVLLRWKVAPRVLGLDSPTILSYEAADAPEANAVAQALSAKLGLPLAMQGA